MRVIFDMDLARYQYGSVKMPHPFAGYGTVPTSAKIPASVDFVNSLVEGLIKTSLESCNTKEYICVLSGKGNFRNEISKQTVYKGNRNPNLDRPYHYNTVGNYICNNHPHIIVDGYEADDWIGIEQRRDLSNSITASRDKDLDGFPGYHYRWACGANQPEKPVRWISPYEAVNFFFQQMLTGDNTDNILGCGIKKLVKWGGKEIMRRKGVGKETAKEILAECNTVAQMYIAVSKEYKKIFGDNFEEVMLENARLLYIGQTPDNLFNWDWLDYNLGRNSE